MRLLHVQRFLDHQFFVRGLYPLEDDNLSLLLDANANGFGASVGASNINSIRFGRDGLSGIGSADPYAGNLDEIRIYSRALDASEISELYRMNTSSTVNTSGFLSASP